MLKYAVPILAPLVLGFLIAYLLKNPIRFLSRKLKIDKKICAIAVILLFYCTIGILITLLSLKLMSVIKDLIVNLPQIYTGYVEPRLLWLFNTVELRVLLVDEALADVIEQMETQLIQSLGGSVSGLSVTAIAKASGIASSLPGLFIKTVLMIISSFFIGVYYDRICDFCLKQAGEKVGDLLQQVEGYVVGPLFVCIRSYLIIMLLSFAERVIGLSILRIDHAIIVAALIAVFDILPVLGTGGIMIPWTVLAFVQGDIPLGCGLLLVYVVITVIRNIVEPKIVGKQLGLHPIVTLTSMFAGVQLFGIIGLFGLPIGVSLLKHLNDNGTIHVLK